MTSTTTIQSETRYEIGHRGESRPVTVINDALAPPVSYGRARSDLVDLLARADQVVTPSRRQVFAAFALFPLAIAATALVEGLF